jgi:hypothetical protein
MCPTLLTSLQTKFSSIHQLTFDRFGFLFGAKDRGRQVPSVLWAVSSPRKLRSFTLLRPRWHTEKATTSKQLCPHIEHSSHVTNTTKESPTHSACISTSNRVRPAQSTGHTKIELRLLESTSIVLHTQRNCEVLLQSAQRWIQPPCIYSPSFLPLSSPSASQPWVTPPTMEIIHVLTGSTPLRLLSKRRSPPILTIGLWLSLNPHLLTPSHSQPIVLVRAMARHQSYPMAPPLV